MTDDSLTADVPPSGRRGSNLLRAFINSPFSGLAPWILLSMISGPGRFEEAASAALGVAIMVLFVNWRLGGSIKLLEWFDVAFFGIYALIGLFASNAVIEWLELWGGEVSNIALVSFAVGSILLRRPFTLEYAREQVDEQFWEQPIFIRTNYVITWAWAAAFGVQALSGLFGDLVLHTSNNFWTGWIIQIGAIIFAIAFTEFYPDYGPNKAMQKLGLETEPPVSVARLFDWLPIFILITGIAALVTDSTSTTVGVTLIVVGVVGGLAFRRIFPDDRPATAGTPPTSAGDAEIPKPPVG